MSVTDPGKIIPFPGVPGKQMRAKRGAPFRVIIESPFAADSPEALSHNTDYARACMLDSLMRGEFPFASHLLYPQVLEDSVPVERDLGIRAGMAWGEAAHLIAVYTDLGISPGMEAAIQTWRALQKAIDYRSLGGTWASP